LRKYSNTLRKIETTKIDCTVIICCRNAEESIKRCLESVLSNNPSEIIVIDGFSTDKTVEIISNLGISFHQGLGRGLTADRQLGIDLSKTKWSFFVDSDHVLPKNFLATMRKLIEELDYTLIQSKLEIWNPKGLLNKGENCYYELVHNSNGENIIPGIAPAVFLTENLKSAQPLAIADGMTATIDDTNWAIKAMNLGAKIGIFGPKVSQFHSSSFIEYYKKFKWYGIGDGEFCIAHPLHRGRHYFHLIIRYPIIYSLRSLRRGLPAAIPFLVMQGLVRGFWCGITDFGLKVAGLKAAEKPV
jgi:glycosyltransferase involved in cell wall biosynthesis